MRRCRSAGFLTRANSLSARFESLEARRLLSANDNLHYDILPPVELSSQLATSLVGTAAPLAAATYPLASLPELSSLPGARAALYLDFTGHFDAVWGEFRNVSTPAYDIDGNAGSFSDAELAAIHQIWAQVAEDYAPFNINVTTVEPPSFANGLALRVVIGGDGAWLGDRAGGIGYINAFTNSVTNSTYVFPKNLAGGHAKFVAEASSHEAGHSFGLDHQALYDGAGRLIDEYYAGPGDGRAPIMGDSYDATRGVWWAGQSSYSPYEFQDDMNIIARPANGFGYRPDEHSNGIAGATPLVVSGNQVTGSGVIMIMADTDFFSFTTGAGTVTISAVVPAGINNLDTQLRLYNSAGSLITSAAPAPSFNSTVSATLAAGTYYVAVASQGAYGDIGQYIVTGTIVPANNTPSPTLAAPTNLVVTRGPGLQASLSWVDNATGETAYVVERRSDIATQWVSIASLAANSRSYIDAAVADGRVYEYRVKATDGVNSSDFSNIAGTTFVPTAPSNLTAQATSGTRVDLAWSNISGELGYKIERLIAGGAWTQIGTTSADVTTHADNTAQPNTSYQYRVRAHNYGGDSAYSPAVSITTPSGTISPPAAPISLSGVAVSGRQINLHWYDQSNNEQGFLIQRSIDGASWTTITSVAANVTSIADFSVNRRTSYYYRVLAFNQAGASDPTNVVRVTTPRFAPAFEAADALYAAETNWRPRRVT
jgi:pre-peptidase/fibronectin type III domain protein